MFSLSRFQAIIFSAACRNNHLPPIQHFCCCRILDESCGQRRTEENYLFQLPPHPCMHQTLCNHVCNSLTISGIRCTRNDNIKGLGRVAQPAKSLFKYKLQELCRRLIECEAVHSISVTFSNATPPLKSGAKT